MCKIFNMSIENNNISKLYLLYLKHRLSLIYKEKTALSCDKLDGAQVILCSTSTCNTHRVLYTFHLLK